MSRISCATVTTLLITLLSPYLLTFVHIYNHRNVQRVVAWPLTLCAYFCLVISYSRYSSWHFRTFADLIDSRYRERIINLFSSDDKFRGKHIWQVTWINEMYGSLSVYMWIKLCLDYFFLFIFFNYYVCTFHMWSRTCHPVRSTKCIPLLDGDRVSQS